MGEEDEGAEGRSWVIGGDGRSAGQEGVCVE